VCVCVSREGFLCSVFRLTLSSVTVTVSVKGLTEAHEEPVKKMSGEESGVPRDLLGKHFSHISHLTYSASVCVCRCVCVYK